MSGHSKWSTIKRKKGAIDAKRAAVFTKIGRELQVAVKLGGPDPDANSKLKDVIAKAKAANMPNENIKRSISRASGAGANENYDEIVYEGYGPSGVAIMVKCLTDNRNRSAADVRHLYNKYGGNMGTNGCVSFMFQSKGKLIIDREEYEDEDKVTMDALEAGASDILSEEDVYVIYTEEADFSSVREKLEDKYNFLEALLTMVPDTFVDVEDEEANIALEKMIDALEDNDDVNEVYHNWNRP